MDKCIKTIKLELYDCFIKIIVTNSISKKIKSIYKKCNHSDREKIENPGDDICGSVVSLDMNYHILFNENYSISLNTITHEVYHLVQYILKDRAIESKDDEAGAWLMGYLCEQVCKAFNEKKIKII